MPTPSRRLTLRDQLGLMLWAAVLVGSALYLTASEPPSSGPRTAACAPADLSSSWELGQGAVGTIYASVTVHKASPGRCSLSGYPALQLRDTSGELPTDEQLGSMRDFGAVATALPHQAKVTLKQGEDASFLVAYSDVPAGTATSCPAASSVKVSLAGRPGSLLVTPSFPVTACSNGWIKVSYFFAGRAPAI